MTSFNKDTIELDAVSDSKVTLPDTSTQLKVYFDGATLKQVGFDGKVTPLVPNKQQIKVIDAKVTTEVGDVSKFTFRIPNTSKKIADLNSLVAKINSDVSGYASSEEFTSLVNKINESILTLENEIKIVDGKFADLEANPVTQEQLKAVNDQSSLVASDITLLGNRIDTVDSLIVASQETLRKEVTQVESNLNSKIDNLIEIITSLHSLVISQVSKSELAIEIGKIVKLIPSELTLSAISSNVHITKTGSNYGISVDIPEVTKEVTKEIIKGGGGISKSAVENIVADAIAKIPPAGTNPEVDAVLVYNIDGTLSSKTTSLGSQTYVYDTEGYLINIVGTGIYKSKTFIYDLNNNLTNIDIN